MNPQVEPPQKKRRMNPSPSFLSLPDVIIVNCLARISRSYYPKLSLVCKTFSSLCLSKELSLARFHLKTFEKFFIVCLQLPDRPSSSWFSLWIKPDQTLTNDLEKKKSTGNTLLVSIPSSYYSYLPDFCVSVGSEYYGLSQRYPPSRILSFHDKGSFIWRKASTMTVARQNAVACVFNEKIYVMGGCRADVSENWGEVFDTKTRTWESLPDPGAELRKSSIREIKVNLGKIYVRTNGMKDYVYDPEKGKWDIGRKKLAKCTIEYVSYRCDGKSCLWYDTKRKEWRAVRGLAVLIRNLDYYCLIDIANYRGKLLVLWDKFVYASGQKDIWCAVITLEKRNNDDEVWGNIEWANVVLTVPNSYVFVRSQLKFF